MEKDKNIEGWVRKLYELGFTPIPIGNKNGAQSKIPVIFEEGELKFYRNHRPSIDVIETWLSTGCYNNIGLLMGAVHGNICCIDIDNPEVLPVVDFDEDVVLGKGFWVQKTPRENGRYHIYMIGQDPIDFTREVCHDVELRGNTCYCMFTPSMNEKGGLWRLLNTETPDDLSKPRVVDVYAMWDKWKNILNKAFGYENKVTKEIKMKKVWDRSEECIRKAWESGVKKGQRKTTIYGLSSWLKQKGMPVDVAEDTILAWFDSKCEKGDMSKREITNAIHDAFEKGATGCTYMRNNTDLCPYKDKKRCRYFKPDKMDKKELAEKYSIFTLNKSGEVSGVNCHRLADLIINEHDYHFMALTDETTKKRQMYYYDCGYYHPNGEHKIASLAESYMQDMSSKHRKEEVINDILDREAFQFMRSEIEPPVNLINVNNGIYDINTDELLPHDYKVRFLNKIPVNYVPGSKCPRVEKFFSDVFPHKGTPESGYYSDYIPCIQEMFGYTLYRCYKYHKVFMLFGTGRNGKGVTISLLRSMLGYGNYSSNSLHHLIENQFGIASLYGKLANIAGEISDKALSETGPLKWLSGGEPIGAEFKYHGRFEFINYAKLIFAANKLPHSHDYTLGFVSRWIIPVFSRTFMLDDPDTDVDLATKIINNKREMEGLLCWSIDGLKRLLKNNNFSYHDDPEATLSRYQSLANPDKRFITERLEVCMGNSLEKDEVYEKYVAWTQEQQTPKLIKGMFTKALCAYIKDAVVGRHMNAGKQVYTYDNIRWKDDYLPADAEPDYQSDLMSLDEKRERYEM